MDAHNLHAVLEFSGGAELLFDKVKEHDVRLPIKQDYKWTIGNLLLWIKDNLLKERPELFIQGNTVRPGILVLVNDTDWELLSTSVQSKTSLFWVNDCTPLSCLSDMATIREDFQVNYNTKYKKMTE